VGARSSPPVQTGPGAHPTSCTMGTVYFPGVKSGRGVTLTPHPLLVPWSRKGRGIPLLPLWAVRPVQSVSACTMVHFTFTFTFCPQSVDMRRLTTGIRSEKCVVRRFRRRANVTYYTYTNLDSIAYYTSRLYGIAYCS